MKKNRVKQFCLLTLFMLWTSFYAFAQEEPKVSIHLKNASLQEVFSSIETQTSYRFSYRETVIDNRKDISLQMENTPVSSVLNQALRGRNLTYKIVSHTSIVITDKVNQTGNQNRPKKITGIVRDSGGEPVIGASILAEGSTYGTTTDIDGRFSLDVSPGSLLIFSYIGYQSQKVAVKDKSVLEIVLKEDTELLDEVVVVGYGTQKKQNLTGATTTVNMDKVLGNRPVASTGTALRGVIPGLQISNGNGEPGASNKWSIRGAIGTINEGGGSPLVLVDNVEMDIDMLNPNDIESVTVLKDAASSAIYGARAAFGVILITTKKGSRDDSFHLNFNANWAMSTPMNLPKKASPLQTVEMYKNTGDFSGPQNLDKWINLIKDYNQSPSSYPNGYVMGTEAEGDAGIKYSMAETDMIEDMMSSAGFQQIYDVVADGGNKNMSYRMSLGYVNEDGILISSKDSYERYNVTGYIRSDAKPWIKPELDFKYSNSTKKLPETNANFGIWGAAIAFPSYYSIGSGKVDNTAYDYNTPANFIKNAYATNVQLDNLRLTGRITLIPLKDWNVVTEYTLDKKFYNKKSFNPIYTYLRCQDDVLEQSATETTSAYNVTEEKTNYSSFNLYSTYSFGLGERHFFKTMAGFSQESYKWEQLLSRKANMINQDMPSISGGVGEVYSDDNFSSYTLRSGFFRMNYSYADKYLLEVNGRYDGSSKFPTNSRFGLFPSISAAWRISQEPFMQGMEKVLSNLKLRCSYGTIGNQNILPYKWLPGMSIRKAAWYLNGGYVYTLNTPGLVSSSFTWEKVKTLDLGLDASFLQNRLNMTFDWYVRDTNGMLAEGSKKPSVLGTTAPLENTANLRTKGWELAVNYNGSISKDIDYTIGITLYDSKTKITKFDNVSGLLSQHYNGQYINEIWGYETDRYYTEDDFNSDGSLKPGIPYVDGYSRPNPGDVLYIDHDKNGIIDKGQNTLSNPGDRSIIGNSSPRYQYGINGGISYKKLSFSFLLQGVGKRDLWISNELFWPWFDEYSTLMSSQRDYWTKETPDAYFPRVYDKAKKNTSANRLPQTKYLQNGAYLSIRNITVSYKLPKKWLKPVRIAQASVFASGENIATFDHLPDGLDPEAELNRENARGWTYPYLRKWSAGVKVTF